MRQRTVVLLVLFVVVLLTDHLTYALYEYQAAAGARANDNTADFFQEKQVREICLTTDYTAVYDKKLRLFQPVTWASVPFNNQGQMQYTQSWASCFNDCRNRQDTFFKKYTDHYKSAVREFNRIYDSQSWSRLNYPNDVGSNSPVHQLIERHNVPASYLFIYKYNSGDRFYPDNGIFCINSCAYYNCDNKGDDECLASLQRCMYGWTCFQQEFMGVLRESEKIRTTHLSGYTLSYYDTATTMTRNSIEGHKDKSCFTFDRNEKVVYWYSSTKLIDGRPRVGGIKFLTSKGRWFSVGMNTQDPILANEDGTKVNEYYSRDGVLLAGLHGYYSSKMESIGPVFVVPDQNYLLYPYFVGRPVGYLQSLKTFDVFSDAQPVQQFCAWRTSELISGIKIKSGSQERIYGRSDGSLACINIGNEPITWDSASTVDGLNLGYLKIQAGRTVVEWSARAERVSAIHYKTFEPMRLGGVFGIENRLVTMLGPLFINDGFVRVLPTPEGKRGADNINYKFEQITSQVQSICFTWDRNPEVLRRVKVTWFASQDVGTAGDVDQAIKSSKVDCFTFKEGEKIRYWTVKGNAEADGLVGEVRFKTTFDRSYISTPITRISKNQISSGPLSADFDLFEYDGFTLIGIQGFEERYVNTLGPVFRTIAKKEDKSIEYPQPSGNPLYSPYNIQVFDTSVTEFCCWNTTKSVTGIRITTNEREYNFGKKVKRGSCIRIEGSPIKWVSKGTLSGKVGYVQISTETGSITCSADARYLSEKSLSIQEWRRLVGFYGSYGREIIQFAPVTTVEVMKQYLFPTEGAIFSDNFSIVRESLKPVAGLCFDNGNGVDVFIKGMRIRYEGEGYQTIGTFTITSSCFDFEEGEMIRYMRTTGSNYGVTGRVGQIKFHTNRGRTFSTLQIPESQVFKYKINGQFVRSEKEFYDFYGLTLVGFHGYSAENVDNIGPIFRKSLKELETRPSYLIPTPVGNLGVNPNTLFLDRSAVQEICCWANGFGVTGIYMRTEKNQYFAGKREGVDKCLVFNDAPLLWESQASSYGNYVVGMLKISSETKSVECRGGSLVGTLYKNPSALRLSGIQLFYGKDSSHIESISPFWDNGVKSITLVSFALEPSSASIIPKAPQSVAVVSMINESDTDQSSSVTGKYATVVTDYIQTSEAMVDNSEYSIDLGLEITAEAEVELSDDNKIAGGIGLSIGVSTAKSKSFAETWSAGRSLTTEEEIEYSFSLNVPPMSTVAGNVMYYENVEEIKWRGVVEYLYYDDTRSQAFIDGKYAAVSSRFILATVARDVAINQTYSS